jgi:hypothetical protein
MDIYHRVTFNKLDRVDDTLDNLKINYKKNLLPGDYYTMTFEIYESDERWKPIEELIDKHEHTVNILETIFTNEEILKAEYVRIIPTFQKGYPEPKSSWVSNPSNYEVICKECGTFKQISPFKIKDVPKMGKNDFFSLIWTWTLFGRKEVLDLLKKEHFTGYTQLEVLLQKTEEPFPEINQLYINEVADPGLRDNLNHYTCLTCGVTKYDSHVKGIMHLKKLALNPDLDFQESFEWFGWGGRAYREIIVSNRVAKKILEEDWKGIRMKVVELL